VIALWLISIFENKVVNLMVLAVIIPFLASSLPTMSIIKINEVGIK